MQENMVIMIVFGRLCDQWQYAWSGIPLGIPNSEVKEMLDFLRITSPDDRIEILDRLKIMTSAITQAIQNEQQEKKEADAKA